ncbi:hypothetical protein [Prevotella sp. 10(H)]|uniref:hypothetical protein n=1 Tax=Prevotella sp. 10(H) TaxID=1158294 RepID=UPI000AB4FFCC|nr:hypothetical protein [Prevotella sp. 10(H)]
MKRVLFAVLPVLLSLQLYAQKKSDFNIVIPESKVENSKYNALQYIESRPDSYSLGIVYVNAWNGIQEVTLSASLESQLESLIKSVASSADDAKTMAVQMRALFFDFGKKGKDDKAICSLRMSLYEKDENNSYYFLNTIDTVLTTEKKEIRQAASDMITSFITDNMVALTQEDEKALTMDEVMDIDFYEKNSIPFYTQDLIPDGVYKTYRSLMSLNPDIASGITIGKQDGDDIKDVKIPDEKKPGKTKTLKAKEAYAIVVDGVPYIGFDNDFHKAYKQDDDWRFVITQKVAGSGFSLGVGVGVGGRNASGGVGLGIPIGGKKENIEIFIDQLNGAFIWGEAIKKEK